MQVMRAEEISFHEEFDGVMLTSVFHEILPVALREVVFRGCYRALKRPGVLLNRDSPYPGVLEEFRDPLFRGGDLGPVRRDGLGHNPPDLGGATGDARQGRVFNGGAPFP